MPDTTTTAPPPKPEVRSPAPRVRVFWIVGVALTVAFAWPLFKLVQHAVTTDLHSHILLIPFISWYLWRLNRNSETKNPQSSILNPQFRSSPSPTHPLTYSPSPAGAALVTLLGLGSLAAYWVARASLSPNDRLSLLTFSYLVLLLGAALATLGWSRLRADWFPLAFLIFMVPTPDAVIHWLSVQLQHRSADLADIMLRLTGMPVLRDDLAFRFPGLSIYVAEECSGIRSTLVLFITSTVAAYMFLRSGWKRAFLVAAILPLGVLRNAFRITTISSLSVNVDPGIIHSPLHHRGGPIFFALSLLPLVGLLWFLRRSERTASDRSRK